MAEYTPTLDEAKGYYLGGRAMLAQRPPHPREGEAEFDRFLARVRRDAARSAVTEAMGALLYSEGASPRQIHVLTEWRDTHYPETEDQT